MQQHITAIIPCYNEENKIKEVIKDVSNYCSKILVIDDNSTDKSLKVISQLKNEMDIDLNIFKNEKKYKNYDQLESCFKTRTFTHLAIKKTINYNRNNS